jgi:succinate dehydrogenase / fumarate reductase cytochrome b subunit
MAATVKRRPFLVELYRSAIGKKWLMAISGIILLAYLIAHLVGNLKVYLGVDPISGIPEINEYGEALRRLFYPILPRHVPLWIMRAGLFVATVVHVDAATRLTIMNRRARSIAYAGPRDYQIANYASRTMRWSGFIVLGFVLFHLADLTWGLRPAASEAYLRGDIQANLLASLSRPPVAALYIVANLVLAPHIFHGTWSLFQSLGVNHPHFNQWRRYLAWAVAIVLTAGNLSFPVAIWAGWLKPL